VPVTLLEHAGLKGLFGDQLSGVAKISLRNGLDDTTIDFLTKDIPNGPIRVFVYVLRLEIW
jgi:hypothetical protein